MAPRYTKYYLYDDKGYVKIITTDKRIYNRYRMLLMGAKLGSTDAQRLEESQKK